jgi:hypothetical protein
MDEDAGRHPAKQRCDKHTHAEQENLDYHRQSMSPDAVAILRI